MRQFARPFPITRLSLEARVLYTGFLLFLVLGFVSSVWLYADSFGGLSGRSTVEYYRGGAAQAATAPGVDAAGGPALELPPDGPALELPGETAAVAPMRLEKPARQVMETFHFHLFTVPVVLLIVGHLFMLTALSVRLKVGVITLASVATFVHLLAPLLVRFVGPQWGWLMPVSVVGAAVGWLPMLVWPLWEMWRPVPASSEVAPG
ncbi:hypothetical protein ATI61_101690 [Archangium gephyra]|uniref:Uncharacterized protein n=1 Tax=Archangium gephyra TaxID=48 RepID=A0AAC8TFJ3_9BACT|nr:hypothetical protein [Archangium gephyra]AKJ04217.1 Hypothetical protein AA314_05843 [Archangium gephyra]REG37703.1 hypothetical protein ATI61_101690 [Archangium gephyra]